MIKINGGNGILTCVTDLPGLVTLTASDPGVTLTPSSFTVGGTVATRCDVTGVNCGLSLADNNKAYALNYRRNSAIGMEITFLLGQISNYGMSGNINIIAASRIGGLVNWGVQTYPTARQIGWYHGGTAGTFSKVFASATPTRVVIVYGNDYVKLYSATGMLSMAHGAINTDTRNGGVSDAIMRAMGLYSTAYYSDIQIMGSIPTGDELTGEIGAYIAGGDLPGSCILRLNEEDGDVALDANNMYDWGIDPPINTGAYPMIIKSGMSHTVTGLTGNEQSIAYDTGSLAPGTAVTITARRVKAGFPTGRTPDISTESDTCAITVPSVRVSGVTLSRVDTSLDIGDTRNLVVTVWPLNASDRTYTLATSDPTVATIPAADIVGVGNGSCNIVATTTDGGFTATCVVSVPAIVSNGVTIDPPTLSLGIGDTESLTATVWPDNTSDPTVTWTSSDPVIATVDPVTGDVTGVAYGTCTAIATTVDAGAHSAHCHVTVPTIAVAGISLNYDALNMTIGQIETLIANVWPASATDKSVTWWSTNPLVASVLAGLTTGVGYGSCTIIATTVDGGFTHSCTVTIAPPPVPNTTDYVDDMLRRTNKSRRD